ncbi:hypothetical protein GH714_038567 [Hevea brasiliensis]|uniref:BAG domain-containing protein n=1 Tax=Hevea brasiliensis TaxID=3981 RepID=A0A6A6MPT4_HEVBR|nr:hypothetical protein GH714_038567 [Hevea brasiliensis]
MDSYPLHGNQMPWNQNYHPSFEAVPPVAKVDPSKSVVINHPWLYPNSFGYSVPCYHYCSQGNFPCYCSYGPPPFSSPQLHYCGYRPPFLDVVRLHYAPPLHYLRELPRYEYDKPRNNDYHCCGCRNRKHDQRNGESVRIEEQEPNIENKKDEFLVPFPLKNYPYPVLWIPPEYMKNEENRKSLESDMARRVKSDKTSIDKKHPQIVKLSEQDPGGEAEKKGVEMDSAPKSVEEVASSGKLFPVKCPNGDDSMNKSQVGHENSGSQADLELNDKKF